jgi:hypothetical protein
MHESRNIRAVADYNDRESEQYTMMSMSCTPSNTLRIMPDVLLWVNLRFST